MLGAFARVLAMEGRVDPRGWRAEEWTNIRITAWCGGLRGGFIFEVGMGRQEQSKREKSA